VEPWHPKRVKIVIFCKGFGFLGNFVTWVGVPDGLPRFLPSFWTPFVRG